MYSAPADALHNFASGAKIGGCTEAQACWGYLVKHLVALRDKIINNDFSNKDDLKEKCQDSINYIRFIWAIAHEGEDTSFDYNFIDNTPECANCKYNNVELEDDGKTWKEPCKSCKNGIPSSSPKYKTAELKWELKEDI